MEKARIYAHPFPETTLAQSVKRLCGAIRERSGAFAWAVGGFVRDHLLGRNPHDVDVATRLHPDQILALFPEAVAVGKSFGVVRVPWEGDWFEVTTFRRDGVYEDGRHPDKVTFSGPEDDARRRDFTVNALFWDPLEGKIHDFVGGMEDLERRTLRAIGKAEERFSEDFLRILRALRFSGNLDFTLDGPTMDAIVLLAPRVGGVSAERIVVEFEKALMGSARPGDVLALMKSTGVLESFLPEVGDLAGQDQPPEYHPEGNVFEHVRLMLNHLGPTTDRILLWSVLMHDIAKPVTAEWGRDPGGGMRWRFDGHARAGAEMAGEILTRLKLPGKVVEAVSEIVDRHMRFMNIREMRASRLRSWMGNPLFEKELELHRLDCLGCCREPMHLDYAREQQEKYRQESLLPEPFLRGRDLIDLGFHPGPELGSCLNALYEGQLEGDIASREEAIAAGEQWLKDRHRK